jgi:nitroreductase
MKIPEKTAASDVPISPLLARRWSPRAVSSKPVEPETLRTLFEAARWAPSCFNEQPWRYLIFDHRNPEALEAARSCLVGGNAWAKKSPVLLISVARETFTHNGKPNRHGQHDVGLASENLVLQATELGLISHQMAGFDAARARELFKIPEGFTPMAMIVLGYPGDLEELPPDLQDREKAPRTRKPLAEFAFSGTWEAPFRA